MNRISSSQLEYQDLGNGIYCMDTAYQRRGLAACYLIREGDRAAFIDTGTSNSVPMALELMAKLGISTDQISYVMPTHVHLDHAGGAGRMMEIFPQAQLVVHPFGAKHLIKPDKLRAGTVAVYGEQKFNQLYGEIVPVEPQRVIEAVEGCRINLNGRELVCVDSPGHARHHYCVFDGQSKGFFTGDTFGLGYSELASEQSSFIIPTTTPVQFDPDAWQTTLDRLLSYQPEVMYLAHFGAVTGVAQLAQDLCDGIDAFVEIALAAPVHQAGEWMEQALMHWAKEKLTARGCKLNEGQIESLLGMDMGLNAQGLEIWLSRRK